VKSRHIPTSKITQEHVNNDGADIGSFCTGAISESILVSKIYTTWPTCVFGENFGRVQNISHALFLEITQLVLYLYFVGFIYIPVKLYPRKGSETSQIFLRDTQIDLAMSNT
jgi:hypothetical protein